MEYDQIQSLRRLGMQSRQIEKGCNVLQQLLVRALRS